MRFASDFTVSTVPIAMKVARVTFCSVDNGVMVVDFASDAMSKDKTIIADVFAMLTKLVADNSTDCERFVVEFGHAHFVFGCGDSVHQCGDDAGGVVYRECIVAGRVAEQVFVADSGGALAQR